MNDPINRADAIRHLKKRLYETALNSDTEHPYYEEIADNRIDVWMNEVPSAQPEQRWIPVSERLPDVAQRVLLSGHGRVMVGMLHSFGKYSLEPTGISYVYPTDDIEAWMPLPEPYEGES